METDAELVAAAKRGSREALARIFDRHWPRVWRAFVAREPGGLAVWQRAR